jgi:hypothetical protein
LHHIQRILFHEQKREWWWMRRTWARRATERLRALYVRGAREATELSTPWRGTALPSPDFGMRGGRRHAVIVTYFWKIRSPVENFDRTRL